MEELPGQIELGAALTDRVSVPPDTIFTVVVCGADIQRLAALEPTTVYTVADVGLSVKTPVVLLCGLGLAPVSV